MSNAAKVIDLEEYRRRRASLASPKAELMPMPIPMPMAVPGWGGAPAYCVWYPVWYWVPVVGV